MSLPKESIQILAQTQGIQKLKDDIAIKLANDVEYRIREIIQDAAKYMKHSKRKKLTCEDINHALIQKNVEPLYGYQSSSTHRSVFRKVNNAEDLFFIEDLEVDIDQILQVPLPKLPNGPTVTSHWLAIEGVQPKIPQNPKIIEPTSSLSNSSAAIKQQQLEQVKSDLSNTEKPPEPSATPALSAEQVQVKPLVKHVLSAELQMYYEKVTEAIKATSPESALSLKASLQSLSSDPGLNQLVPYFTQFVAEEVTHNLRNLPRLKNLMEMVKALLVNPHLHIELYLHQLMPSILTCLVGKTLCSSPQQDHWSLRQLCAYIIGLICKQYGSSYHSLQSRITRTLLQAFLDPQKPRTTHYGAITGITALGPHVAQLMLLEPKGSTNLKAYWTGYLEPILNSTNKKKYSIERHEALMCYSALLQGASLFFVKLSKFFRQDLKAKGISSSAIVEVDEEDEANPSVGSTKTPASGSNEKAALPEPHETLTKSLKERMTALQIPADISDMYNELHDIFGESLLPFISYDIVTPEENEDEMAEETPLAEIPALATHIFL